MKVLQNRVNEHSDLCGMVFCALLYFFEQHKYIKCFNNETSKLSQV